MFAGLYGVPGLILGLGSPRAMDSSKGLPMKGVHLPSSRDVLTSVLGGLLVGWMPGMTAGSSATICAPSVREYGDETEVRSSLRFIWLYSSISSAGSVFSVAALFMILRARSGCMDAAQSFLGGTIVQGSVVDNLTPLLMMLSAMLLAACIGHWLILFLNPRLHRIRGALCSPQLALVSLAFVCSLSLVLTGTRGALVLATATCLGLLPPLASVRRIQLMGCLLVPITMKFFGIL
jgi:putative membrane protein